MNQVVLQEDLKKIDSKIGDLSSLDTDLKTKLTTDGKNIDCINALNEVFQCGNNVKQNAVTALIAKGSTEVTATSTWEEIIKAITDLVISGTPGAPGTLEQVTKLNITASTTTPATKTVLLDNQVDEKLLLATSLLLFVPGDTGVVEHICSFNNSDGSNFNYDSKYVVFDGTMHPINSITSSLIDLGVNVDNSFECYECEIDESPYKAVDSLVDNSTGIVAGVVPPNQLITPKSDINLNGIETLKVISESSQGIRFALSFDSGATYNVWNGSWISVDINNLDDVKTKFMTKTILDSLTSTQIELLRNNKTTLRIAYCLEQNNSGDPCYTDQLDITVDMKGKDIIAPQANWSYRLLDDKQTIEYTFYVSGTYTINYVSGGV